MRACKSEKFQLHLFVYRSQSNRAQTPTHIHTFRYQLFLWTGSSGMSNDKNAYNKSQVNKAQKQNWTAKKKQNVKKTLSEKFRFVKAQANCEMLMEQASQETRIWTIKVCVCETKRKREASKAF